MRLFVFSLLLAVSVVLLSVFFFDAGAGLQEHLMWVLTSTIGGMAVLGIILALLEGRRDRLRQQKRQSYLKSPSRALRTLTPAPMGPASSAITAPSVAFGPNIPEPSEPPPAPAEEIQEEKVAARTTPDNGISTQSAAAYQSVLEESPVEAMEETALAEDSVEPTPQEEPAAQVEQAPAPTESQEQRTPADQILYLARDFELSEIKRVLDLWQLSYDGTTHDNILGRWVSQDGTLVEVLSDKDGTPYIEIRGPMADELAEFLPQDLPVYPGQPQNTELM